MFGQFNVSLLNKKMNENITDPKPLNGMFKSMLNE